MSVLAASLRSHSGGPIGEDRRGPTGFSVELLLERLPPIEEYRYKVVRDGNRTFYVGLVDGVAHFFVHDPRNQQGFGGRTYSGVTEDGESFAVKGPWSSGPSEINALGILPPLVEASGTDDRTTFERGHTFYALSGVTLDLIKAAEKLLPGWRYEHRDHARHPASFGAAEEQVRVIEHPSGPRSGWLYERDFDPCPTCTGRSFVGADTNEKGAWKSSRTGEWTKICPTCGNGCDSGIIPVPGMRWRGRIIR